MFQVAFAVLLLATSSSPAPLRDCDFVGDLLFAAATCAIGSDTTLIVVGPGDYDGCSDGVTGPETYGRFDLRQSDRIVIDFTVGHDELESVLTMELHFGVPQTLTFYFDVTGIDDAGAETQLNGVPFGANDILEVVDDIYIASISVPTGVIQVHGLITILECPLPTPTVRSSWGRVKAGR